MSCGNTSKDRESFKFVVRKFSDITQKIIPLFQKNPVKGVKALDFADFCQDADLMKEKKHLTKEGLEKIKQIKARMNRGRII